MAIFTFGMAEITIAPAWGQRIDLPSELKGIIDIIFGIFLLAYFYIP
jgi:hypothetical protein